MFFVILGIIFVVTLLVGIFKFWPSLIVSAIDLILIIVFAITTCSQVI